MFKACFIAHARDADLTIHRSTIETNVYTLHTVVVRKLEEAVEVIKELVHEKGVQSVLLCPGFTHQNVAEIANEVKGKAGVAVSRADGPSNSISRKARTGR